MPAESSAPIARGSAALPYVHVTILDGYDAAVPTLFAVLS
jgi:hypothetical protein